MLYILTCKFEYVYLKIIVTLILYLKNENDLISTSCHFPRRSVSKESTCNAEDPGLIPGSERSAGEGIGYPLQHSWASLVAQLVKNLRAMWETCVQSLGWEDPLEKGRATHSSILAWRIPMDYIVLGVAKSWTRLSDFHFHFHLLFTASLVAQTVNNLPAMWKTQV